MKGDHMKPELSRVANSMKDVFYSELLKAYNSGYNDGRDYDKNKAQIKLSVNAETILNYLPESGWMIEQKLMSLIWRDIDSIAFNKATDELVLLKQIARSKTGDTIVYARIKKEDENDKS
jgi:hypothetical protein